MNSKSILLLMACIATVFLASCAAAPSPSPAAPPSAAAPTSSAATNLTQVTVVMGYIPDIQFAPWYVADQKGYFTQEGIQINFRWGFEIDGVKLLGANQADFAMLGGDQVIQARSQGIPIVYISNWYNAFPITVVSLKEKNIVKPQDLVGKRVGLPAYWGASYSGWRALLYGANIKEADVQVQDIGFTQVAALTQGAVDAAVCYANNEPVQLTLVGKPINVINVWDYTRLVGMGIATNEKTIAERPELVTKTVRAFIKGLKDTIDDQESTVNLSLKSLPEAGGANLAKTRAVLAASVALWKNSRLGYVDPADWVASVKFMKDAGFIKTDVDATKVYTNQFIP